MDSTMQKCGHCSMCQKNGKITTASDWCTDCETYFCNNCLRIHMQVSNYQDHDITKLVGNKRMKLEGKLMCKEHDKKIKHFCRSCVKPVCKDCSHNGCKDVITLKDMLPEVKGKLMKRQERLGELVERKKANIAECDVVLERFLMESSSVKSQVTKTIQAAVDRLREKETEVLEKLDVQTDQQTEKLRSNMKSKQTETEIYSHQSEFIQQALEIEDEAQLLDMYLSSLSGTEADVTEAQRTDTIVAFDIIFIHDLDKLKDEMGKMDVRSVDNTTATPDLTATPVLHEVIDAELGEHNSCGVRDAVVMNLSDVKITVFADFGTDSLKSVYQRGTRTRSSILPVSGCPWCITVISEGNVAVSLNNVKCIITVAVTPDLELLSTIQTSKEYWGLSSLDQSTLVAGSETPPAVDLIDVEGNILKTFTTLPALGKSFRYPGYIHVTRHGRILVSDYLLHSVICLTRSGDIVFTYAPEGMRALRDPYGITSTGKEDILVADFGSHKVIHLSESGEFLRDILTEEDGVKYPFGMWVDEDQLCVTVTHKGLHKYKFVNH